MQFSQNIFKANMTESTKVKLATAGQLFAPFNVMHFNIIANVGPGWQKYQPENIRPLFWFLRGLRQMLATMAFPVLQGEVKEELFKSSTPS